MKNFLDKIANILEEDNVSFTDELTSFEAWDSLAALSIIALADEDYGIMLNASEILESVTIGGVKKLIEDKLNN